MSIVARRVFNIGSTRRWLDNQSTTVLVSGLLLLILLLDVLTSKLVLEDLVPLKLGVAIGVSE